MANDKDLIRRYQIKNALLGWDYDPSDEDVKYVIDYLLAVDAVEVVHASWIERFSFGCWHYYCSNCEDGYTMAQRQTHKSNYCPNCGARMDLEE